MSHPLIVEAAESLFVPVLVHNNRPGVDQKILKRFGEPAWNNPVIRFVDHNEKDVIARKDGVWTTGGVAARMLAVLDSKHKAPAYLRIVAAEENGRNQIATFAMHCFWQGEVDLGGLEGVKHTQAAWLHGKEVVEVVYDPQIVTYQKLLQTARQLKCASTVFARTKQQLTIAKPIVGDAAEFTTDASRPAKESDQHFYLRRTILNYLPLTPMQATKINSALLRKKNIDSLLSPRQTQLLQKLKTLQTSTKPKNERGTNRKLANLKRPTSVNELAAYEQKLKAIFE